MTGPSTAAPANISFRSGGELMAATWYPPSNANGPAPCVVMGHGFTLTRQQGIPAYAERLAAAGFAALAFDYRHWGESGGQPRRWVSLRRQLDDWKAAVAFARTLDGVDPDRIVVWGMSMGGGHAFLTASEDPRIAAVVGLVPSLDRLVAYPRSPAGARMLAYALAETVTRRPFRIAATGRAGSFAVGTGPEALSGFTRLAAGADWLNDVNTSWVLAARRWHPIRRTSQVRVPVLLQLGERDTGVSPAAIEATAMQAAQAELRRYDIDHFGCFLPGNVDQMVGDQIDFLRRHVETSTG